MVPLRATDARELTLVVATRVVVVVIIVIILCCRGKNWKVSRAGVCVGVGVYASECSCASNELKLIQSVRSFVPSVRPYVRRVVARACEVPRVARRARCVRGAAGGRGVSEGYHRRVIIREKYQGVVVESQIVDKCIQGGLGRADVGTRFSNERRTRHNRTPTRSTRGRDVRRDDAMELDDE